MKRRNKHNKTWPVKLICLSVTVLLASIAYYFFFPDVAALRKGHIKKTSFMEYREREWRQEGKKIKIRQVWTPLPQISPFLEKAAEKDIRERKFRFGASTISQQLAKNLYLSPSKNPLRKLKEAILTWRMEKKLTKRRILELYLNVAEWGEGLFGIEAASRSYYGKPAAALDPEEAARLASVLPNPIKYNPRGTSRYVSNRSRLIYNIMVKRGIVIPQYEEIMTTPAQKDTIEETPAAPAPSDQSVSPSVSPQPAPGN